MATFYIQRNKARVEKDMLSLFPLSYEHDIEADLSLPPVLPPYLPPKLSTAKDYTLVLDLDETLIHFEEEQEYSPEIDGEVFYLVRPGVSRFL